MTYGRFSAPMVARWCAGGPRSRSKTVKPVLLSRRPTSSVSARHREGPACRRDVAPERALVGRRVGIERGGAHARLPKSRHLIRHQRQQRRHHKLPGHAPHGPESGSRADLPPPVGISIEGIAATDHMIDEVKHPSRTPKIERQASRLNLTLHRGTSTSNT